ncbi:hypothetical protein FB561_0922 [Kribbella amoyensis]|uniref:Uncharacterized protein n=1 Tax=Kribbella amoyensis TaxID=996641 RepID=A0A561BLT3_9ACTN|nr:hypothetical protein [Kribbella amoyensis]TWD79856.1 hypothetical protein FB561_0922 [Kribbella amoyensis]
MRKSLVAAATTLAVVATGLAVAGIVGSAGPADAALSDVPADCQARTSAYRADGQRLSYKYAAKKTSVEAIENDNLGWVPTAMAEGAASGGEDVQMAQNLVTHPTDGKLYLLKRVIRRTDGVWRVTEQTTTPLASGFAGTRILVGGPGSYYYRVAGKSLYRFQTVFGDGAPRITTPVLMPGTAWNTVKTLKYQRTGGTAAAPIHVLFGGKTTGELKEWQVSEKDPAKITSKVVRPSGFNQFTSINAGFCSSRPNGRSLLGITATGSASIYFDANEKDGLGSDIKGGSLGALNWTEKAY